jgi:hypothetical protein
MIIFQAKVCQMVVSNENYREACDAFDNNIKMNIGLLDDASEWAKLQAGSRSRY